MSIARANETGSEAKNAGCAASELWPRHRGREIVLGLDFRPKKIHNHFVERRKQNEKTTDLDCCARDDRAERSR
jgi:hypothetical protein